ncbi:hypothetical protein EDB80DRAFT_878994 [Ilyonectria destructans]|nr:hypothetical protein EDB80DRAFT_878994 [Ilyonectria destructans]
MKHLLSITLLIHGGLAMANFPFKCLYNPVELVAGLDLITMRTAYPLSEPCTATIDFDDWDFLPVTYTFKPISCDGPELAQFPVPLGAPTGEAYITWRCASELLMCSRALISGGQSDRSLNLQVDGHDGQVIYPDSSTLTTVVTKRLTKPRTATTELTTTPTGGVFLGDEKTSGTSTPERTGIATTADVTTVTTDATAMTDTSVTTDATSATDTAVKTETTVTAVTSDVTKEPVVNTAKEKVESPEVTSGATRAFDHSIILTTIFSTVTVLHTVTTQASSCPNV